MTTPVGLRGILRTLARRAVRIQPPEPSGALLSACAQCHSSHVVPVARRERGSDRWWIRLRCGDCHFVREVIATDGEARRLDAKIARGMERLAADLAELERERMVDEVHAFAVALRDDLIDADDFRR